MNEKQLHGRILTKSIYDINLTKQHFHLISHSVTNAKEPPSSISAYLFVCAFLWTAAWGGLFYHLAIS